MKLAITRVVQHSEVSISNPSFAYGKRDGTCTLSAHEMDVVSV